MLRPSGRRVSSRSSGSCGGSRSTRRSGSRRIIFVLPTYRDLTNKEEYTYHLCVTSQIQMSPQKHILWMSNRATLYSINFTQTFTNIFDVSWLDPMMAIKRWELFCQGGMLDYCLLHVCNRKTWGFFNFDIDTHNIGSENTEELQIIKFYFYYSQ